MKGLYAGLYFLVVSLFFLGCKKPEVKITPIFKVLDHTKTGLNFANVLTPTASFNMFKYMYFYNGAGVGAADFNNDGLIDLFFASNQKSNQLFLNKGKLHFEDVTIAAKIPNDGAWNTGVSVVDINNDGLMDIYICRVGNFDLLKGRNQLLICKGITNGIPFYADEAQQYGLDFSGFSTQAAFLDFDLDGDLDMYLLNHAINHNGRFAERKFFLGTYDSLSGDRLYRNDMGKFTDATKQSCINSNAIGYGLGIAVSDINLDGWPDLYIGNDFHENDYLYINQKDGTFKDETTEQTMHTSQFTMGVDVADVTNDGYPEIVSMDMLPEDPYILKRSLGEDTYDIFKMKLGYGYHPYFTRNNLQLNRRNGHFSEIGLYSGIAATDWSWAALWMDFDNDGRKDLFVSNGIPKRLNDIDYVNFISNEKMQEKIVKNQLNDSDFAVINKFPEIKLPNYFYKNIGNAAFKDMGTAVENNLPTFSNGSVYADLDNDGDLDVVVNNIADPVLLYQNTANDSLKAPSKTISLKGPPQNINAIGSKVIVYSGNETMTYEKQAVHGFLSSMEIPLHVGTAAVSIDSAFVIWPDNSVQVLPAGTAKNVELIWQKNLPKFNYAVLVKRYPNTGFDAVDLTATSGLNYVHEENKFLEFNRETLLPQMMSTEGPTVAVSDINGDGLEDIFIGAAREKIAAVFLQTTAGKFRQLPQPGLAADSVYEDVDACWTDVNNDHFPDLIVASGGNEFYGNSEYMSPRLYLNDGKGTLTRKADAFANIYLTASCIAPSDFDGDGRTDLFIGARCTPFAFGQTPRSYWLKNNGNGSFVDVSDKMGNAAKNPGLVTHALWCDIDKDGDSDLLLSCQWNGLCAFINTKGKFERKVITNKLGWWNFMLPFDADGDGDMDLMAGNLGLNNRIKASVNEPAQLYVNDFDGNGNTEQILTYYLQGKEIPFANKDELQKQMPFLKKKFLYAEDFAKAKLTDIIPADKMASSQILKANYFDNALLINDGKMNFEVKSLPWLAQLSPMKDGMVVDANGDQFPDVLMVGNFYENNIQMGRNDADYGSLLINKGKGNFVVESLNGLAITGESRHIKAVQMGNQKGYIVVRNNAPAVLFKFSDSTRH